MKTFESLTMVGQLEPTFVTFTVLATVFEPMALVTITLMVYEPTCVKTGVNVCAEALLKITPVAGEVDQAYGQPAAVVLTFEEEPTLNEHGRPPAVQSPLRTGSGPFISCVSAVDVSMFKPAQPPVTAVGDVIARRALMPRLVNALLATVNAGMVVPVPPGPLTRTAPLASRRSHLYCSAAACAAESTLVSDVTRDALLKVMSVDVELMSIAEANGSTAYFTPLMSIGMSESETWLGEEPV